MRILVFLVLITLALSGLIGCEFGVPQAQFSYRVIPVRDGFGVQFNDQSTGDINAWEWDFNCDGIVDSTTRNPYYTYYIPGNYTISLTVSGPSGNDTETKIDYIRWGCGSL